MSHRSHETTGGDNEEPYRSVFDAVTNGLTIRRLRDCRLIAANPAMAQMFGYSQDEFLELEPRQYVHADNLGLYAEMQETLRQGESFPFAVRGIHRDGSELQLEGHFVPFAFNGEPHTLGIVCDVSERNLALEQLRRSEKRFRELFEESRDAIFITCAGGAIKDVNEAAVELFGFASREKMLRANVRDLYQDPADRQVLQALLEKQGYVKDYEAKFIHKSGKELTVLVTATAARSECGQELSYRGLLRDITRQRSLEQHLRQTQKMEAIGRLAGGVAHDFNNLLTAINGYAELSLTQIAELHPAHDHLREILRAGEGAATLTRQLLALSRQQVLSPRVLDLGALVGDFEKLLGRTIGEDIDLRTVLEPHLWRVKADPGQLEQVLMNLAVNARDAMLDGGRLVIETANMLLDGSEVGQNVAVEPGPYVLLTVTDTGCGMDRETQSRVFEPFFTTKEEGKGTGLGLATVYGIVKQSGGFISVYSEPGEGTTVKIYLPRVFEALEPIDSRSQSSPRATESKTILLVEDNEMVRDLVARVLVELGHRVLAANSPSEAVRISAEYPHSLDLLLTDLVMPEMSGLELAEKITLERPNLPVLVMSGYSKEARFNPDPLSTKFSFIQKPFTPDKLQQMVSKALQQPAETPDASDA